MLPTGRKIISAYADPRLRVYLKDRNLAAKTEEITITAMALPGTDIIKKKSTTDTTSAAYTAWYQTVASPTFPAAKTEGIPEQE